MNTQDAQLPLWLANNVLLAQVGTATGPVPWRTHPDTQPQP